MRSRAKKSLSINKLIRVFKRYNQDTKRVLSKKTLLNDDILEYNIKRAFNNLWIGESSKISGLKVIMKGRLRGAAKKRKIEKIKGSVKSQSLDYSVESYNKCVYTKWGTFGIRINRLVR